MQKDTRNKRFRIADLLKPHSKLLVIGFVAVAGEAVANLLEPWPLKIVLDNVLKSHPMQGWLNSWIVTWLGQDQLRILEFAAMAVLAIAIVGCGMLLCGKICHHQRRPVGDARSAPHAVLTHPAHCHLLITITSRPAI